MKIVRLLFACTAVLVVGTTLAQAEDLDKRFYIAPAVSYSIMDDDSGLENDLGGQLLVGKAVSSRFNLELFGSSTKTDTETTPTDEATIEAIGITGLYFPNRAEFPFFALASIAKGSIDSGTTDQDADFYDVGGGFTKQFNDYGFAYRLEYRFRRSEPDSGSGDNSHVLTMGFQIPFGAPSEKTADSTSETGSVATSPLQPYGTTAPASGTEPMSAPLDKRFYISPSVTYTKFDDSNNLQNELGLQWAIGKPLTPHLNLELYGFGTKADTDSVPSSETEIEGLGGAALYFFDRDANPFFLLAGLGQGHVDSGTSDVDADFYDLGVGFLKRLNHYGIAYRAEYRYRHLEPDSSSKSNDNVFSFGFQIPLGKPAAAAPPPPPPVAPAPVPMPAPVVIKEVPPPAPQVLHGVQFEYDSARLTPAAKAVLNDLSATLRDTPGGKKILIMGHTCNRGSGSYNQALSQRRAESVRAHLVSTGIPADRLEAKGYGESRPLGSNATEEDRIKNRRVEMMFLDQDPCIPPGIGDSVNENGCAN